MTSARQDAAARYVPAAGFHGLTRFYDTALALTMRERQWRPDLIRQVVADVPDGGAIVDVGSGTGTLAIGLARARPGLEVFGIDGDPEVLARAAGKEGAEAVDWREGLAGDLPFEDHTADAVVMSLLLHHLTPAAKRDALAEARRILRPGGRLHIADWGQAADLAMRAAFLVLQAIDGVEGTRDHVAGRLPAIIASAGFTDVRRTKRLRTGWGTLEVLEAARSEGS